MQTPLLQVCVCELSPEQFRPPFCGIGSLHSRVLVVVPLKQVTEHVDHELQRLQLPSTIIILNYRIYSRISRPAYELTPKNINQRNVQNG
jgi:hypothetical protein